MKTVSISIFTKLAHLLLFTSKEGMKGSTHIKSGTYQEKATTAEAGGYGKNAVHPNTFNNQRKIYTGNFFAGAQSVFDPRF